MLTLVRTPLPLLAALLTLTVMLTSGATPVAPEVVPEPVTHTVVIEAMRFQPDQLTIKAGDAVMWVNKDLFPHTVRSRAGRFESPDMKPGESWTYTVTKSGDLPYVCTLHPTMTARLRVEEK